MILVFRLFSANNLLEFLRFFDIFEQLLSLILEVIGKCLDNSCRFLIFDEAILFALSEIHSWLLVPDRLIKVFNVVFYL